MCRFAFNKNSGVIVRKYANDFAKELFRKAIHLCAAFIPFFLSVNRNFILSALAAVLILYCAAEFSRIRGKNIPLISKITEAAARKRDQNGFVFGPVTLTLGILLSALFFSPLPAAVGIYALAFGDGIASLAGKIFGQTVIPHTAGKTVAGSLTCFAVIFISTWFLCGNTFIALCIAFAGMFIELLPLKDLDNLLIPLALSALAQFYFHM